ncbi:hypothetical protein SHK09_15010 [Polaribacter sp. PL03]|uniref:hypothetical protein n=1 Tax=Polaribacter sp. PL03 TaxID=3088353 RepID=UPI0029CFAB8A|nr:hypothetical protein [Polaribacter sp. PL03]MDX6748105.1 hypothetical protein [Polaribacter sp. PL03]
MKKNIIVAGIVGVMIQCFGLGFMLYGVNNNEKYTWIGYGMMSFGMMIVIIGLIIVGMQKLKNEKSIK